GGGWSPCQSCRRPRAVSTSPRSTRPCKAHRWEGRDIGTCFLGFDADDKRHIRGNVRGDGDLAKPDAPQPLRIGVGGMRVPLLVVEQHAQGAEERARRPRARLVEHPVDHRDPPPRPQADPDPPKQVTGLSGSKLVPIAGQDGEVVLPLPQRPLALVLWQEVVLLLDPMTPDILACQLQHPRQVLGRDTCLWPCGFSDREGPYGGATPDLQ